MLSRILFLSCLIVQSDVWHATAVANQNVSSLIYTARAGDEEFLSISTKADRMFADVALACDAILEHDCIQHREDARWDWRLLPDGLIWHSFLAAPHEPRISTVIFNDTGDGIFWDATLGGRVGLLRYGTAGSRHPSGWQWDLEGAVMTRLDLLHAEDIESMDYRFGTEITAGQDNWSAKFGYFHVSSHVGDEYMIRNPLFRRINYVTESLVFGMSHTPNDAFRLYGETAFAFRASGGARPWQFQTGVEYTPVAINPCLGAPFVAINFDFRQSVDFDPSTTVQAGWSYFGDQSERRLRFGLQYSNGPTSQFEFFTRREEYIGVGAWFDY